MCSLHFLFVKEGLGSSAPQDVPLAHPAPTVHLEGRGQSGQHNTCSWISGRSFHPSQQKPSLSVHRAQLRNPNLNVY